MNDEKNQGIIKNHKGFLAEEVEQNIPKDVENIIFDGDGSEDASGLSRDVKKLNYVKLNGILWGCVQQQQQKIEHLEACMFEMMEEIEELKGKGKAKAKAKAKSKEN